MTQFDTIPEEMHSVAGQTRAAAVNLDAGLSSLMSYCLSLEGWVGDASGTFQNLMAQFKTSATKLNEALTNIAQELDQNAANYELGESTNNKQILSVAGSLPTINL
jgi:ESAT-6 family protein